MLLSYCFWGHIFIAVSSHCPPIRSGSLLSSLRSLRFPLCPPIRSEAEGRGEWPANQRPENGVNNQSDSPCVPPLFCRSESRNIYNCLRLTLTRNNSHLAPFNQLKILRQHSIKIYTQNPERRENISTLFI